MVQVSRLPVKPVSYAFQKIVGYGVNVFFFLRAEDKELLFSTIAKGHTDRSSDMVSDALTQRLADSVQLACVFTIKEEEEDEERVRSSRTCGRSSSSSRARTQTSLFNLTGRVRQHCIFHA